MRQKLIFRNLLIVFLSCPCAALAQITISACTGYGSWSMNNMQDWQEEYRNSFPVEAKTLAAFPPYVFFEGAISQQKDRWIRGVVVSNGSTGGRVYYSDYSGNVSLDQSLSFYALGGIIGRVLNRKTEKWLMIASMRPGVAISKMSYEYEQAVKGAEKEEFSNGFSSYNFTLQPGISLTHKFGRVGIEAQAGYLLTIVGGKLTYEDDTNIPTYQGNIDYLITEDKAPVTCDWSGYRISLGVSVRLN